MHSRVSVNITRARSIALLCKTWSPFTWRARFVLNYKKVPYTTEWVAFPDIGEVLSAVGAPPTSQSYPKYSVPAIIDASVDPPVVLSDSAIIADYLEKTYPKPSIYPHGREAQIRWSDAIMENVIRRMPFMVIPTTPKILPERDAEYFVGTRKMLFGVDVKDMVARSPEEEAERWQALEEGLSKLSALTDEIEHGERWLFGTVQGPGYADFVLAAMFIWFRLAGPEGGWERIEDLNGGKWKRHLAHVQEYQEIL